MAQLLLEVICPQMVEPEEGKATSIMAEQPEPAAMLAGQVVTMETVPLTAAAAVVAGLLRALLIIVAPLAKMGVLRLEVLAEQMAALLVTTAATEMASLSSGIER